MELKIDASRPLSAQIQEQLTFQILSGNYKEGDILPDVKQLSAETGINPNIVNHALCSLDEMGLTKNTDTGRVVVDNQHLLDCLRASILRGVIREYFTYAASLGYSEEQAKDLINQYSMI